MYIERERERERERYTSICVYIYVYIYIYIYIYIHVYTYITGSRRLPRPVFYRDGPFWTLPLRKVPRVCGCLGRTKWGDEHEGPSRLGVAWRRRVERM